MVHGLMSTRHDKVVGAVLNLCVIFSGCSDNTSNTTDDVCIIFVIYIIGKGILI